MQFLRHLTNAVSLNVLFWSAAASAQTATPAAGIAMELNGADQVGEACRITFVATNQSETVVDKAIYETVLFSTDDQVLLLTLFDFGNLPVNVPRVRQFQMSDTSCDQIGSVLINGANTCTVNGAAAPICGEQLKTSSRIDIKLQG